MFNKDTLCNFYTVNFFQALALSERVEKMAWKKFGQHCVQPQRYPVQHEKPKTDHEGPQLLPPIKLQGEMCLHFIYILYLPLISRGL